MSWPLVELGSVAAVSWGNTSITKESYCASGYSAFSAAGEDGFLEGYENDCDGIVLSAIGARCGRCFKASGKWTAIKNTITILEKTQRVVCLQYLFHFLSRDNVWPSRGGAQPFIALGDARRVKVPLPPLAEQKRIAAILDKADAIRRKRQQAIQLADDFLRAVFLDMFGDPVTNPKGWASVKLGEVCGVGSSKRVFVDEFTDTGVPFYRGTEVGALGEGQKIQAELFISQEHYDDLVSHSGAPEVGDLLLPSICHDGRIWKVNHKEQFYFKDGRVLWIKLNRELIDSDYLRSYLQRMFLSNYSAIASGTTFAELKIVNLKAMNILSPPLALQRKFSELVKAISESGKLYANADLEGEDLFSSLAKQAFSGQL